MRISIDWSHKEKKLAVFDGKKIRKTIPKLKKGDKAYAENIPAKYAQPLLDAGVEIYRCRPNDTAELRETQGGEKTDAGDARLIWELMESTPEIFRRWKGDPALTTMYHTYKEVTQLLQQQKNRRWAKGEELTDIVIKGLEKTKNDVVKAMKKELAKYAIYSWLQQVEGIGPATAAGLIAYIDKLGIENIDTVSSMRHYLGVYPVNGKAARKTSGAAVSYNPSAKTLILGEIAPSFVKQTGRNGKPAGFYRTIYEQAKSREINTEFEPGELAEKYQGYKKDETRLHAGHADNRAKRRTVQLFLSHLWVIWRQLEGLETRPPYVHEVLKHKSYIKPPFIPEKLLPFKPF